MFSGIFAGAEAFFTLPNILIALLGVVLGIIVGAIPGLGPSMAVAVLVPITYAMHPSTGMLLLMGVFCGAVYGGSITAILLNVPGTPANVATMWDGNTLARKGYPKKALSTAIIASFVGGILSALALLFASEPIAKLSLKFGPAELAALAIWGLSIICSLESHDLLKGLLAAGLGLFVATIGISPEQGTPRYTFGVINLYTGINYVSAMIGLFCFPEIVSMASAVKGKIISASAPDDRTLLSGRELRRILPTSLVEGLIGTIIGTLPGAGGTIASFISYNNAKSRSKDPSVFGTGELRGIAAPESSNNGASASSLIPLLTLGIPGSATAAVFLGALTIHGLQPGPLLFSKNPEVVYCLLVGTLVIQVMMVVIGLLGATRLSVVSQTPVGLLAPFILIFSVIGSYATNNNFFEIGVMLVFGIVGCFMKKFGFSRAAFILAIILGPLVERNITRALQLSDGAIGPLFSGPICIALYSITILMLALPFIQKYFRNRKASKQK